MFEKFIFNLEKRDHFVWIFFISLAMSIILGLFNYIIGGNFLFLVALVSLFFSYPFTKYFKNEVSNKFEQKGFISRISKELVIFWSFFLGVIIGFLICFKLDLIIDSSIQSSFVNLIRGNIINISNSLSTIFINNLLVAISCFIISFLVFSGLIFIIVWNASILTFYLSSFTGFSSFLNIFTMLHGFIEIGGFIFAGIAGAVLSNRIDKEFNKTSKIKINKLFIKDIFILLFISIIFIFLGALLEVL